MMRRQGGCLVLAVLAVGAQAAAARAQGVYASPQSAPLTAQALVRMSPAQLDALYAAAAVPGMPSGPVRGRAVVWPGSSLAGVGSKGAGLVWQGKVFHPCDGTAINRFFGVKMIRGQVTHGPSWRDGQPALILDYQNTSWLYARNRDEIRQVAPGLYLGLMYGRSAPGPRFKRYFVLEQ